MSRGPRCREQNDEDLFSYEDWDLWWQLAAAGFGVDPFDKGGWEAVFLAEENSDFFHKSFRTSHKGHRGTPSSNPLCP